VIPWFVHHNSSIFVVIVLGGVSRDNLDHIVVVGSSSSHGIIVNFGIFDMCVGEMERERVCFSFANLLFMIW